MFFPWYSLTMLGFESVSVISKRLAVLQGGGLHSLDEIHLMFSEKVSAVFESSTGLMLGGTVSAMVDRFREQVAANEARLSLSAPR